MKLKLLMAGFLISVNLFSQIIKAESDCSIGNLVETSNFKNDITLGMDKLMGIKFTLASEGTLKSINIIGSGTNDKYKMALYSDNNDAPDTLITFTNEATIAKGFTQNSVTPVLLPAGNYWVMAVYKFGGGNVKIYAETVKTTKYYATDLVYGDDFPKTGTGFVFYKGLQLLYSLTLDCGNTLSAKSLENNVALNAYPNPSNDYIKIAGLNSNVNYTIRGVNGNIVLQGITENQQEINLRNLAKGLYFITIDGFSDAIKIVK